MPTAFQESLVLRVYVVIHRWSIRCKTKTRSYKLGKKPYMIMVLGYLIAYCTKELVRAR